MCKSIAPARVRRSKYPLLLLLLDRDRTSFIYRNPVIVTFFFFFIVVVYILMLFPTNKPPDKK